MPSFCRSANPYTSVVLSSLLGVLAGAILPVPGVGDRFGAITIGGIPVGNLAQPAIAHAAETHSLEQSAQAWLSVGREAFEQGEYDAAIDAFSQAIQDQPNLAIAHYNRGVVHFVLQHYDAAFADYSQTIRLDPDYTQAYVNRGNLHSQQGRAAAALDDYSTAIKLDPTAIEAHYNLALIQASLQNWDAARAGYDRTLDLLPENSPRAIPVYLNRGSLNLETGQPQAAIEDSQAILEIDPNNAPAHGNLGFAYMMLGDLDRAKAALNSAATLFDQAGLYSDADRVRSLLEAIAASADQSGSS